MSGKFLRIIDRTFGAFIILTFWLVFLVPEGVLALLAICRRQTKPNRIAVVRLWAIGEAILTFPMVEELKKKWPDAKVHAITTNRVRDVLAASKLFDEIKCIKPSDAILLFKKYDMVIDTEPFANASSLISFWIGKQRIGFKLWPRQLMYTKSIALNDKIHESAAFLQLAELTAPVDLSNHADNSIDSISGRSGSAISKEASRPAALTPLMFTDESTEKVERLLASHGVIIGKKDKKGGKEKQEVKEKKERKEDKKGLKGRELKELKTDKKTDKTKADRILGVAPAVADSAKSRMWPIDRLAKVCKWAHEKKGMKIIIVGGKADKEIADELLRLSDVPCINICGMLNISETAALMKMVDVFLSNDTGPMHIAAAQGAKTIGLFGPNIPQRFAPLGHGNISIYKGECCKYSPCINVHKGVIPECYYSGTPDYQKCMKAITEKDVKDAIEKLLN